MVEKRGKSYVQCRGHWWRNAVIAMYNVGESLVEKCGKSHVECRGVTGGEMR